MSVRTHVFDVTNSLNLLLSTHIAIFNPDKVSERLSPVVSIWGCFAVSLRASAALLTIRETPRWLYEMDEVGVNRMSTVQQLAPNCEPLLLEGCRNNLGRIQCLQEKLCAHLCAFGVSSMPLPSPGTDTHFFRNLKMCLKLDIFLGALLQKFLLGITF